MKSQPKKEKEKHTRKEDEFVQKFLPMAEIRNGIIEMKDGRYVKIIEIEPINFMLRSSEEQFNIISSFASWLKISPIQMQFKSISRKADSDHHVSVIQEELRHEEDAQCRKLAQEYLKLIQDVGSKEALTRRFFLIFQYEHPAGHHIGNEDYAEIYGSIQTVVQNARTYFSQCGNELVRPEDEDMFTAELLYMFFNRQSCVEEPFSTRIERVVVDTMKARRLVVGVDPVPEIPVSHFVAPRGIDLTHYNHIVMDGTYYTFLLVRHNGYPNMVRGGWLSALINAGEGIDIDLFLTRENRGRTIDKVAQRIRLNRSKLRSVQDTSTDFEELANSIQSGYYIKNAISNNNEDLFYMSLCITVSASTKRELNWRKQQILDMMKSMDIHMSDCNFRQEQALMTVMPFVSMDAQIKRKTQRNLLTSGAASTYMFTSFELSDDNGVLLGLNRHNNSLCIVDLFNSKRNKNANMIICGTTGSGKTYTIQAMALRMRMRGIQTFILAPLKGHEFRRACMATGGSFIRISPGSANCVNIMAIRQITTPELDLIDEIDYNSIDSLLAMKIQQLMIFFSLLIPDMTNVEEQLLDEALVKTYSQFGITHDNGSLYTDETQCDMKTMPILGDLHHNLLSNEMTSRLAVIVGRFVTGSAQSFNQQTNVDLDNKYVVFDISELKGRLLPVGMFIVLDYVWDAIKADRTKKKVVIIDEIWHLLGGATTGGSAGASNRQAAEFCLSIWKIIRGYGGGALAATQDLSDFFSLDDGKYGRAILNASKTKLILNLEQDEAAFVKDTLKLTRSEIRAITQFDRGEALLINNNNKVPIIIKSSKVEQELITTDRAELASILERRRQAAVDTQTYSEENAYSSENAFEITETEEV